MGVPDPDPRAININGGPQIIYDSAVIRETRQRHAATWFPTAEDPGMDPDPEDRDRGATEE